MPSVIAILCYLLKNFVCVYDVCMCAHVHVYACVYVCSVCSHVFLWVGEWVSAHVCQGTLRFIFSLPSCWRQVACCL